MIFKRGLILFCLIGITLGFEVMADDNVKENKKALVSLQAKIQSISVSINELKTKQDTLLIDLKRLDIEYGETALQISRLGKQVKQLNRDIKKNTQQIKQKKIAIDAQKQSLAIQVKAAHAMGRNEKIKLLLNQQDPIFSSRMMTYYGFFNQARLKKISKIDRDLQLLNQLEQTQQQQQRSLALAIETRQQQKAVLLTTKSERQHLLSTIQQQYQTKTQQLNHFKLGENRLKRLINSLRQVTDHFPLDEGAVQVFSKLKGSLPWPLKGRLLKKFGAKRSDSRWDGVLIKAKEGNHIRSIARGRVVYADWLRGYGLLTILDHGKGYMSLYAFSQSLYKSVGDWVDAGVIIATVGQSGGQLTAGVYFGIRKQGKSVNPIRWCRKVQRGKVG